MEHLHMQYYHLHQQKQNFSGGTDDYAVTGEVETAYDDRFEDTESLDVNLVLGGRGGGLVILHHLKTLM